MVEDVGRRNEIPLAILHFQLPLHGEPIIVVSAREPKAAIRLHLGGRGMKLTWRGGGASHDEGMGVKPVGGGGEGGGSGADEGRGGRVASANLTPRECSAATDELALWEL